MLSSASCSGANFEVAAVEPDAEPSDSAGDGTVETTPPDSATDDTFVADTTVADTTLADTGTADTTVTDTATADTRDSATADTRPDALPDSADTSVTDTSIADTSVADTSVADTAPVDTGTDSGCAPFDPLSTTIWVDKFAATSGVGSTTCPHKTITAAITQAKALAFKGTIRVRGPSSGSSAAVYDEVDRLDVPAFVTISGDDEAKVQVAASGTCAITSTVNVNCAIALAPDAKLEKITVAPSTSKSFDFGVVTSGVSSGARPVLSYVTVASAKKSGIVVVNGADLHSVTSTMNSEAGVAVNAGRLLADDSGTGGRASAFTDNGTQGVFLANVPTAELTSVQLLRNKGEGLRAEAGAASRSINLRTITASQNTLSGVDVNGGAILVEGGTFTLNGLAGLKVGGNVAVTAVNADFSTNKSNGLELQSASGFTHKLQGVVADGNSLNGVVWGGAALTITGSKLRSSSFSKNTNNGIRQLSHAGFEIDAGVCDSNGVAGMVFGPSTAGGGPTFMVTITNTSASTNGSTGTLGTGIFVGPNTRASIKMRGSKLIGNTGGGMIFDYGALSTNSLDIGVNGIIADPGCNDFGSVKNTKTGICLVNSGAKASQPAEGNTWNAPLPSDTTLWQLPITTDCYSNGTYYEVTYRKSSTGGDSPVMQPVSLVTICGVIVTPG